VLSLALALFVTACGDTVPLEETSSAVALDFPGAAAGKFDLFGRELAGVASPYPADLGLSARDAELKSDARARREVGWAIARRVLEPAPLLGLKDAQNAGQDVQLANGGVPTVPRFQTWYGVDDIKRMFRYAYSQLTPLERFERAPFDATLLTETEEWNAASLERSERWPLERYLAHVRALGLCSEAVTDEECAISLQSKFSGASGGNARITYSPATARHMLTNYAGLVDCLNGVDGLTMEAIPSDPANFTACLSSEFPTDAVLIKAHWIRADFGRGVPVYRTDALALEAVIGGGKIADWGAGAEVVHPSADTIFTIRMKNGDTYRLAGLHAMTKELRHWTWVTLWWSDTPTGDFGADRPADFGEVGGVWQNYKMAVVVDYLEGDVDPAGRFADLPGLAAALRVSGGESPLGQATWSSNPYVEHGQGNARTNCIGCHQHGGSSVAHDLDSDGTLDAFDLERVIADETLFPKNGRLQIREQFPVDYLWSTRRVDDLSNVLRSEVERAAIIDADEPEVRAAHVLALTASAPAGAALFSERCSTCHGTDGTGSPAAPSLFERVPGLTDPQLAETLITGKSPMPSWAHLTDQNLADLRAWVRTEFDSEHGDPQ
jgi:mono/diheme cytochrome c family protein